MVAAPHHRSEVSTGSTTFELIQGSLSAKSVARRSPLLAGLHRVADGTLLGLITATAVISGLTLHWQHRWTIAFRQLENTRDLTLRLRESTAILQQNFLMVSGSPSGLVPTKVSDLVYLERPAAFGIVEKSPKLLSSMEVLMKNHIRPGY